ncbi:MAG TPA: histidine kinase [Flavitalea sp.]|nr:histidine kinase [Flavitalea sp.]
MKIRLLVILIMQLWLQQSVAQKPEDIKRDSLRLDSMKSALHQQQGDRRVNNLNNIAEASLGQSGVSGKRRSDSAFIYGSMAYNEALESGDKHAQAEALIHLATSKQYVSDRKGTEKFIRPALKLSIELKDDNLIGRSYNLLAGIENSIENYKKAIVHFQKTKNILEETESTTWLCMEYTNKGLYEEGFPFCEKCIQLARVNLKKEASEWGHELILWSYYDMYILYKAAGDYETALDYTYKAFKYAETNKMDWKMYADISELYCIMNKPDSALIYWDLWKKDWNQYAKGHQAYGNNIRALIYIKKQQADSALALLTTSLAIYREMGKESGGIPSIRTLLIKAEAFIQKKNYTKALVSAKEAVELAEQNNYRPEMMNGYQVLSTAYHNLKNDRAAYSNLVKYVAIKDSLENKQFLIRLNNYKREAEDLKKEARIGVLHRDNQIKHQQLKQEATFRNFIIAGFIALLFAGLYIFRNVNLRRKNDRLKQEQQEHAWKLKTLESEKKHVELERQSVQLEMQALRAQMNPHFIFNSLSSINHFILKNESKTASSYLTRFSRLIRMVLINSQKPLISLQDELEMLSIYLEMERLRFKNAFNYGITFINTIDSDNIRIPPLLLQPFCENAVWHGLMNKDGEGRLDIELSMENNTLNCIITDNGIGRKKAEEMKSKSAEKEKSMGLKITAERLSLLNAGKGMSTHYTIEDLVDEQGAPAGTRVNVKITFAGTTTEPITT